MADAGAIELLKAVAHPSRLAILESLANGELNVGEIEAATSIGQPALSQQLSVLRKSGLVRSRREAKLVYYALEPAALAKAAKPLTALLPTQVGPDPGGFSRMGSGGAAVFAQLD